MTQTGSKLQQLIRFNNRLIALIGQAIAWATLALVLATFAVVVLRYLFNTGSVALQESLLYLHSLVFLLGAAWTLQQDGHVRVDIFYRPLSARRKALVNSLGIVLLLLPTCIFLFIISWDYVASAWSYREGSRESGGLNAVYLLKTLLLLMPALVILQGLTSLLHNLLVLGGHSEAHSPEEDN